MSLKHARVGDSLTHGATLITGSGLRTIEGRKTVRRGDLVNCPEHGVNPIVTTISSPVQTESPQDAHVTSVAQCGAVVITGSDVMYNEK